MGTVSEPGFDASHVLDAAFRAAGVDLPEPLTAKSALRLGQSVHGEEPRPGDMVVTGSGVHMYVGGGKVITAHGEGEPIHYQPMDRFTDDIIDVRRVL